MHFDAHSRPLFGGPSILNVYEVQTYHLLSHMFCISITIIKNIYNQEYNKFNSDVHQYNTRRSINLRAKLIPCG